MRLPIALLLVFVAMFGLIQMAAWIAGPEPDPEAVAGLDQASSPWCPISEQQINAIAYRYYTTGSLAGTWQNPARLAEPEERVSGIR